MKPSYMDELGGLASSYAWASHEDISPLTQLLDSVASVTTLYIIYWEWWRTGSFCLGLSSSRCEDWTACNSCDAFSCFRWTTEALHGSSPLFSAREQSRRRVGGVRGRGARV